MKGGDKVADINLLKGKIVAKGYNLTSFASAIGMPFATFHRRIKSRVFGSDEIETIAKTLDLSQDEIMNIFFN